MLGIWCAGQATYTCITIGKVLHVGEERSERRAKSAIGLNGAGCHLTTVPLNFVVGRKLVSVIVGAGCPGYVGGGKRMRDHHIKPPGAVGRWAPDINVGCGVSGVRFGQRIVRYKCRINYLNVRFTSRMDRTP